MILFGSTKILRSRERRAGWLGSLLFWRDRTREIDFVVDIGGRLDLFEAKWTELPGDGDTVNLNFVRTVVGKSGVGCAAVISRINLVARPTEWTAR